MAFGEHWLIEVMMRFQSNGSRIMNEIASSTNYVNASVGKATKNIDGATAAMARFKAETIGVGTGVAGAFALAGAGITAFSVSAAASLQRTMIAIKNETGADPRKMDMIRGQIFSVANTIGVTPGSAGKMWLDVSRMTAGQMDISKMMKIYPAVANVASVLNFNRPDVSVEEGEMAALRLVHMFRAYQPQQAIPLLDKMYRLSGLMGESPKRAVTQLSYYEPLFKGLGIDDNTSIAMMALLDRAGFQMRAGTNVSRLMLQALGPLQLTSHAQAGKATMLEQMGVFKGGKFGWNTPSGGVDFQGMLIQLAKWSHKEIESGVPRSEVSKILFGTFGMYGGRIAQLMSDPQMVSFLEDIRKYQNNPNVSLKAGIRNREDSLTFQAGRTWANLQSILVELGWNTLPKLTSEFKTFGDDLHNIQAWLHSHRKEEGWISQGFIDLTAFAAARAALPMLLKILGFVGGFSRLAGLSRLTPFGLGLRLIDNVLLGGVVQDIGKLGTSLGKLTVAETAAGEVTTLATAIGTFSLAVQGSVFYKLAQAGGWALGAGIQISKSQSDVIGANAKHTYNLMAHKYGTPYANYLYRTVGQGTLSPLDKLMGADKWPYAPGIMPYGSGIPQGGLSPHDYYMMNEIQRRALTKDQIKNAFSEALKGAPEPKIALDVTVTDRTTGGIRSTVTSRGAHQSSRHSPPILNIDTAHPAIGH